jgi:exopolysaccharide biosynthesis operon protein EpsL
MGAATNQWSLWLFSPMQLRIVISNISLLLILGVLTPGTVRAAPDDLLQGYISTSITHDNNLFRISSNVDPMTVLGQPTTADTIKQLTLGVKLDWKHSRQEVLLDYSYHYARYALFKGLDYQAPNIMARWNWQTGNRLSGDMGYSRITSIGSFENVQRPANTLNTRQTEYFDGAWQATPLMRLNGSVSHSDYSVPDGAVYGNDYIQYMVGSYYTPRSGNEAGIRGIRQIQKYPVLQVIPGAPAPVDNGFSQNELLATINWLYSGHIRLNGQAGVVERNHNQYPERNYSGNTMRGTLTWLASGKSRVDLTAWNEIDPYDDLTTSYTVTKGVSLGPAWSPTSKLAVSALVQHFTRDYLGDPQLVLYPWLQIPVRQDTVNVASFSINYQPALSVNISGTIQTEQRTSNQLYADYSDKTINLSASFQF